MFTLPTVNELHKLGCVDMAKAPAEQLASSDASLRSIIGSRNPFGLHPPRVAPPDRNR